jgi:hypothetical protein
MENNMNFAVIGKIGAVSPSNKTEVCVEFVEAVIWTQDEKHLIKTFNTDVLIEEITRRLGVEAIIINQIKQ